MRIVIAQSVIKKLRKFPHSIQKQSDRLIGILATDWRHSKLHTKKLEGSGDYYSFRIGIHYRGIFVFQGSDVIKVLDIDHRKDIYR